MSRIFENSPIDIEVRDLRDPIRAFPVTDAPNLEGVLEIVGGLYIPGLHNYLPEGLELPDSLSQQDVDAARTEYLLDLLKDAISRDVFGAATKRQGLGGFTMMYPEWVSVGPDTAFAYPLNTMKKEIFLSDQLHQATLKAISDTLFGGMFHRTSRFEPIAG